ncbi:hypothetical protein GGI02_005413, partial [Coemansia sp. RSA 2322]
MSAPFCGACGTGGDRLHACLQCDAYACWRGRRVRAGGETHVARHMRESGHVVFADFARAAVFCGACGDYVHDAAAWGLAAAAGARWHAALCDGAEPEARRPRIVAAGSELPAAVARYAREHAARPRCARVRGVVNLGATCYLGAVVQALAHNPVLRGWLLADGHHPGACERKRSADGSDPKTLPPCMACEVDAAVQAVLAGGPAAFAPVRLLRALWASRSAVAGAGQQDAHECLVAVLQALHAAVADPADPADPAGPCACIVHTAFAGVLQSAVTCARCGNTTRALDPMLDVALDIPAGGGAATLHECLAHFTRAEALAAGAYRCARCAAGGTRDAIGAVKQLSLRELPPVLTFQLKRFTTASPPAKVDRVVRLPLHIDMTPFTAAARKKSVRANPACAYSLFAIVDHVGQLDTGHYTAFARHRARWFRFDDGAAAPADVRDVLALPDAAAAARGAASKGGAAPKGRAYMAFYVKAVLDYHDAAAAAAPAPPPPTAEWVEGAGVMRVERRGRKKGSTNKAKSPD